MFKRYALYLQDLRQHGFFYHVLLMFTYSAMFSTDAFFVPYYLEAGFSNAQIGILMAVRSAAAIALPPVFGALSDRIRSKRKALLLSLGGTGLCLLLIPALADVFVLSVGIAAIYSGFSSPVGSLAETWALSDVELARAQGSRMAYGPIRAAGSLGYSSFCLVYYLILNALGLSNAYALYGGFALAVLAFVIGCVGGKWEHTTASPSAGQSFSMQQLQPRRLFQNYYYMTFLAVYAMLSCALNFGQNYITQLVVEAGAPSSLTGALNFIRSFLEIPVFFIAPRLVRRFGYKKLLMASCLAFFAAYLLYLAPFGMSGILCGQIICGLAGGLMFASAISYIYELVPRTLSATAQAVSAGCNNVVVMLANLAGGFLVDALGIRSIFLLCAGILLASFLLFCLTLRLGHARGIRPYEVADDPVEQALTGTPMAHP